MGYRLVPALCGRDPGSRPVRAARRLVLSFRLHGVHRAMGARRRGTLHVRAFTRQQPGSHLIEAFLDAIGVPAEAVPSIAAEARMLNVGTIEPTTPSRRLAGLLIDATICSCPTPAASPVRGRPPMRLIPPDPLRRARLAIGVVFLVNGAVFGSWAPHIPLVQERLGLGPALLGTALLAAAIGALVAMLRRARSSPGSAARRSPGSAACCSVPRCRSSRWRPASRPWSQLWPPGPPTASWMSR